MIKAATLLVLPRTGEKHRVSCSDDWWKLAPVIAAAGKH